MYENKLRLISRPTTAAVVLVMVTILTVPVVLGSTAATTFAKSSATNNSNSSIGNPTSLPFRTGVFVMPMMCISPKEVLNTLGNNVTANSMIMQMMKSQMTGGGGQNITSKQLGQAINMQVCVPSTSLFGSLHHNMTTTK